MGYRDDHLTLSRSQRVTASANSTDHINTELDISGWEKGMPAAIIINVEAVVTPATDALLAIGLTEAEPAGACIRCGWCTDHCPARLNVAALNDAYELGMVDLADRAGVRACVQCAVCSYVCPARLPLTVRVRQLKRAASHGKTADISR